MPPDETTQPISPKIPAPQDLVFVAENIPETQPTTPEEIKSEPVPTQKIPHHEPTPQIYVDPINPNITIEKTPDTVTITEVMETKAPVPEVSKVPLIPHYYFTALVIKQGKIFLTTK